MVRTVLITAAGTLAGLAIGVLGPITFVAACVWGDRTEWSALTDRRVLPLLASVAAAGAANGAVGAWNGRRGCPRSSQVRPAKTNARRVRALRRAPASRRAKTGGRSRRR